MKAFEYAAPRTEGETLQLLSPLRGKTELLAGGTDLMGLMKRMIITPERVVNILEVDSLKHIERDPTTGDIRIGAVVHLDEILDSPYLQDFPAVLQAIRGINSLQLQSQGTIGGELCRRPRCWYFRGGHGLLADGGKRIVEGDSRYHAILGNAGPAKFVSASRIAPALIALTARVRIIGPGPNDATLMPVEGLFQTPRHDAQRENTLLPGQLVSHIILPPADSPANRSLANAAYEVRHGEGPDDPLAAAAAALRIEGGLVRAARIVMGQVAPTPWISSAAAEAIIGRRVDHATALAAGEAAVAAAVPLRDNQYKVQLAKVAVQRAILLAAGLETGGF